MTSPTSQTTSEDLRQRYLELVANRLEFMGHLMSPELREYFVNTLLTGEPAPLRFAQFRPLMHEAWRLPDANCQYLVRSIAEMPDRLYQMSRPIDFLTQRVEP